jgi:intracellular sulfur oxidation DsrE/DsrF family protein
MPDALKPTTMIKKISLVVPLTLLGLLALGQNAAYRVVFDITSSDTADQKAVLRQVRSIAQSRPDAQLEVAIYGEALDMVTKGKSDYADAIQELSNNKKASFKVCAATMKRMNIDKSQLIAGVETVPDAIYEIVSKQHEGWGYIKVAH